VSTGGAVGRDSRVSNGVNPRNQKAEGIRICRAYPGRPRGEIEGPGCRREREGSEWKLNEETRDGTEEERGRRGLEVNHGQLGRSKPASDDQRRKGRGQGELRKHAGSSESERRLRGGEYIHDHRHSILNTRRSVVYKWQPEDIVAKSNRAYRPGHRGIQIETTAQKVEGGQVARPAGDRKDEGARLADGRTFGTRSRGPKRNTQKEAYNTTHGANQEPK